MSKATERVVLGILIAVLSVALFSLAASAYKWVCLYNGETYMGVTCSVPSHPIDGVCLYCADDSGNSRQQSYCNNVTPPGCYYINNTCYPDSTKSCNLTGGVAGIKTCSANRSWGSCAELLPSSNTALFARIAALEQWKAGVGTNLTSLNTRLSLLEQWRLTIQATVDSITNSVNGITSSLNTLTSWLGYSASAGFCQLARSCVGNGTGGGGGGGGGGIACSTNSACGIDTPIGIAYCSGNVIYLDYTRYTCNSPGTAQAACSSAVVPSLQQSCNQTQICQNAVCVASGIPPKEVTFRTNAPTKYDYSSSTSEIVLDSNGDGVLECLKYYTFYNSYFESAPTVLVKTPEGFNVNKYNSGRVIIVYGQKYIYTPSTGCTTPTTKIPTAPYSTNGREVYK
jgi:hypothetical protein